MKRSLLSVIFAALVLSACGSDSASYLVGGNSDAAFSLFRVKSYPGADWQLEVALTHLPECQRRHTLKPAAGGTPYKAELFLDAEGYYFLHSADKWYEAQLNNCTLQLMKSVPASPGDLVGTWEEGKDGFKFFPAGK